MQGKLRKNEWFVEQLTDSEDVEDARELIRQQHYAGNVGHPYAYVHGLFHVDDPFLYGVAWWIPPIKPAALSVARYCGDPDWESAQRTVLNLSRLVVSYDVPGNGASFLLGRSVALIKRDGRYDALVTYADTFRGHSGAIYKATNWEYVGLTKPEPIWEDPLTGQQVSKKQDKKSYKVAEMVAKGYVRIGNSVKHKFVKCLRGQRNPMNDQLPSRSDIIAVASDIAEQFEDMGDPWSWYDLTKATIRSFGFEYDREGKLLIENTIEELAEG